MRLCVRLMICHQHHHHHHPRHHYKHHHRDDHHHHFRDRRPCGCARGRCRGCRGSEGASTMERCTAQSATRAPWHRSLPGYCTSGTLCLGQSAVLLPITWPPSSSSHCSVLEPLTRVRRNGTTIVCCWYLEGM